MNVEPLRDCPECAALSLRKLISAAGISVKAGRGRPEPMCGARACPACISD